MAKVFLDTNIFIDIAERNIAVRESLDGHEVYISPISFHILSYVSRLKIPNEMLDEYFAQYKVISLTKHLLKNSLSGPTKDLEDNIQLHSVAEGHCDYFLTNDKELLKMKFFGKAKIISKLN